ncbi:MAG: SIMPL domain-containing protein [Chloroflexi bacterium]|nr:SIMPL domain-containing protein [Chloroflexota bacterium]
MKRIKCPTALAILAVILVLVVGCSRGTNETDSTPVVGTGIGTPSNTSTSERLAVIPSGSSAGLQTPLSGNAQSGIWVTGQGQVSLTPDLALLNLGVEARAGTVAEANEQAASAMNRVMDILRSHRIAEKDIQTQYFNITPQYDYRNDRQNLIGYIVTNAVRIKIRDLKDTGNIIDEIAKAAGNLARFSGISFTVEDPSSYMVQARELAVKDALSKAQQFATLTGVRVGPLAFISESGSAPIIKDFGLRGATLEVAQAPTPISGGELEVQITVQAAFSIAPP